MLVYHAPTMPRIFNGCRSSGAMYFAAVLDRWSGDRARPTHDTACGDGPCSSGQASRTAGAKRRTISTSRRPAGEGVRLQRPPAHRLMADGVHPFPVGRCRPPCAASWSGRCACRPGGAGRLSPPVTPFFRAAGARLLTRRQHMVHQGQHVLWSVRRGLAVDTLR